MQSSGAIVTFIIVAFCLAAVVILRKDTIPEALRRPIAIGTLFMIAAAFVMLLISFFTAGNV
jgi:threonine/homoserine/homoserine lactone efflux protein